MASLTIARKIWASLSILIAGYLAALVAGIVYGQQFENRLLCASEYWFPVAQKSATALSSFNRQVKYYEETVIFGDIEMLGSAKEEASSVISNLIKIGELAEKNNKKISAVELIDSIKHYSENAQTIYSQMLDDDEKIRASYEDALKLNDKRNDIKKQLDLLSKNSAEKLEQELIFVRTLSKKLRKLTLLIFLSVVGGTIALFIIIVNRSVNRPIKLTVENIKKISKGDLTTRFEIKSKDEVGKVGHALNMMAESIERRATVAQAIADGDLTKEVLLDSDKDSFGIALQYMIKSLNKVVSELSDAAAQVASNSMQISSSSNLLSSGAAKQADALHEISSSMTLIGVKTNANAKNAQEASKLADAAKSIAKNGVRKMDDMAASMAGISESSDKISKIIKTIDDIAFQTNLLALNAAVEAARAGRHGKGFTVVAQEVRNLAVKSAMAANETSELIKDSVKKVSEGNQLAIKTMSVLREIEEGVTKVSDLINEIANSSNEQDQSISSVNQGLEKVEEVTEQNTSGAIETSAAAVELSVQAAHVRTILARFRLRSELSGKDSKSQHLIGGVSPENFDSDEELFVNENYENLENTATIDDEDIGRY